MKYNDALGKILTALVCSVMASLVLTWSEYAVIFMRPEFFGKPLPVFTPGLLALGRFGAKGGHMPDIGLMLEVDYAFNWIVAVAFMIWLERRSKKRKISL